MDTQQPGQSEDSSTPSSQKAASGSSSGGGGAKPFVWIGIIVVLVLIVLGLAMTTRDSNEEMDEAGEEFEAMEGDVDVDLTLPIGEGEASETTDAEEESDEATVIQVTGKNFEFSQDEIRVAQGERVRIEFSSTEGFHDWVIDEFEAVTERVNAGESTFVEFVADQAGTFEYYCSVGQHRELGMVGKLIVE